MLLEITVIFLGGILPNCNRFKIPDTIHHARWMAKAFYILKIHLFLEKLLLTINDETVLRSICIFTIRVHIKPWF